MILNNFFFIILYFFFYFHQNKAAMRPIKIKNKKERNKAIKRTTIEIK